MIRTLSIVLLLLISAASAGAQTSDQYYGRIGRSMETFGAVFREITTDYIDQTDPEKIVEAGIRGMLEELDPYSIYMLGDESESVDRLSSGNYVGFGFSLAQRNNEVLITDVRPGYPAAVSGMRRGDRLFAVNGMRVDTMDMDSIRRLTRGEEGTMALFRLVREGRADTLDLVVMRERIPVENITLVERLPKNIGYIRMSRFSRRAAQDLRTAIDELVYSGPISALILDLRGNPGGLLDAAVDVAEVFLPKGSLIVSTRDRVGTQRDFTSRVDPSFPTLPLAVVIDEGSASASEIVAGAIQDHDRGVIVGRRSFGKGLVQTVSPLPYEATLKMTTARYYTPSGRCPQRRIRVDKAQEHAGPYLTRNGRAVLSSDGIAPDLTVPDSVYPTVIKELIDNWVFADFATTFTARKDSMPSTFAVGPTTLNAFYDYVRTLDPKRQGTALARLEETITELEHLGATKSTRATLQNAKKQLQGELTTALQRHADLVSRLLEAEIASRFGSDADRERMLLPVDPDLQTASVILSNGRYRSVLSGDSAEDQ